MAIRASRGGILATAMAITLIASACQATETPTPSSGPIASSGPTATAAATNGATTSAPTAAPAGGAVKAAADVKIIYVGCAGSSNRFWSVLIKGADEAAANLGIQYQYVFPDKVDISQLNQRIEAAIAAKPDGIAFCGLDPNASESTVQQAVDAGIAVVISPPVTSIADRPLRDPDGLYLGQVGGDEYSGGRFAAETLISRYGVKKIACAPHTFDTTQGQRCKGAEDAAKAAGVELVVQTVPPDQGQAADVLTNFLRANLDVDALITTSTPTNLAALESKKAAGRPEVKLASFDLSDGVLAGIQAGELDFAIDQQQFWRGYMPVQLLTHYARFKLIQANNFLSGPSIVDKSNVDGIVELVSAGYR